MQAVNKKANETVTTVLLNTSTLWWHAQNLKSKLERAKLTINN